MAKKKRNGKPAAAAAAADNSTRSAGDDIRGETLRMIQVRVPLYMFLYVCVV